MRTTIVKLGCFVLLIALASSCKKKPLPVSGSTLPGKVKLEFFNNVGASSLNLNNQWYINENGDSFTVSTFNYYISNIMLTGPNGASYTETESYHLIRENDESTRSFDMSDIPAGSYDTVSFMIGVDSARNVEGAQTGALDPQNGMFWDWNTGYIMLKLEGHSPKATNGILSFHCAGYYGKFKAQRIVKLALTQAITVSQNATPHVHLTADVLAMFKAPNKIDFSTLSAVSTSSAAVAILADNYANMFTITYAGL